MPGLPKYIRPAAAQRKAGRSAAKWKCVAALLLCLAVAMGCYVIWQPNSERGWATAGRQLLEQQAQLHKPAYCRPELPGCVPKAIHHVFFLDIPEVRLLWELAVGALHSLQPHWRHTGGVWRLPHLSCMARTGLPSSVLLPGPAAFDPAQSLHLMPGAACRRAATWSIATWSARAARPAARTWRSTGATLAA